MCKQSHILPSLKILLSFNLLVKVQTNLGCRLNLSINQWEMVSFVTQVSRILAVLSVFTRSWNKLHFYVCTETIIYPYLCCNASISVCMETGKIGFCPLYSYHSVKIRWQNCIPPPAPTSGAVFYWFLLICLFGVVFSPINSSFESRIQVSVVFPIMLYFRDYVLSSQA